MIGSRAFGLSYAAAVPMKTYWPVRPVKALDRRVHLPRRVGEEVHDRVPAAGRRPVEGDPIVAVPVEDLDPGPEGRGAAATGQEAHLVTAGEGVLHAGAC